MPEADASKYLEQSRYFENDEDIKMTNLSTDMIISLYLRAKDRVKEISILAQLTASDVDTIKEVLKDAGVYGGELEYQNDFDKGYTAGYTDAMKEIGESL